MATIGAVIVIIATMIYCFSIAGKNERILGILVKTAIFGVIALIVFAVIATVLTSGGISMLLILLLIFLIFI